MSAAWVPDDQCETHEWRSSLGETIRFVTRIEATGRMMPPVSLALVKVPQTQGAIFHGARHEDRLVALPIVVPGAQLGRDELRRWAAALDPLKGEGTLTVVDGPWSGRQLPCVYEAGLDTLSEVYPDLGLEVLAFRAASPYWRDATESSIDATLGSSTYTWFPFLPLILGASNIFAALTIQNRGDVETWPVITTVGPGQDLTISNKTSGLSMHLTGALAAGDQVVIDTRPGQKAVTVNGFNAFGRLTSDSSLWSLLPGSNRVEVGLAAATVASSIHFAWRNRYLSA